MNICQTGSGGQLRTLSGLTMIAMITGMLYLGLIVEPRMEVQAGLLPKPIIWAEPGSVIAKDTPVIIWFQGSWVAWEFHLYKERSVDPWDTQFPLEPRNKANFNIQQMTTVYAGIYKCYYRSAAGLSEHSDAMELVLTGAYEKPRLSVWPGTNVTSGVSIVFTCNSYMGFGRFILIQDGKHNLSWTLDSQHKANPPSKATFVLDAVTPNHTGTFRCYGFFRNKPQVWSKSSDPLDLMVSDTKDPSPAPTEDGLILFRYPRHSKKKAEDLAGAMGMAIQTPPEEDPQGIVYAQVKPSRLRTDTTSKETQAVIYAQRTQEQNHS
ncbi:Leukocyte immunoglobulin-like receptor subfamily B member 4A [Apodemus speciosus]|uniref:Leukocyte immunoglobulin-like receptor subfamily B member 4A n=1 Tax=Apodemus speciosus TaxID=105296 RepID=A0ABQ0FW04_APOSI